MPLTAQLEITDRCNFRCEHCYFLESKICLKKLKTNDVAEDKIFDFAKKLVKAGIFSVVLTGGEPFLRKQLLIKLVKYFKDNNKNVALNTNLYLADRNTLSILKKGGLDGMLVSCPSVNPIIYKQMTGGANYTLFEKKLKMLVESDLHFSINMVINQRNINSIRETAREMKSSGVKRFGATPMGLNVQKPQLDLFLNQEQVKKVINDLVWVKENLGMRIDIFEALPKCIFPENVWQKDLSFLDRKCQAGMTVLSIASNGDIHPCSHNRKVYGNLLNSSISDAWEKMSNWRDDTYIPIECNECKIISKCLGGCRTTAIAFTKKNNGQDPWMTKIMTRNVFMKNNHSEVKITSNVFIKNSEQFKWRKEGDNYLICTKNTRNLILINQTFFIFLLKLRKISLIKLSNLANKFGTNFEDQNFQKVIKILINREFILIQNQGG
ncbi:radical SAM protein [Patescibacteria group bacterium]|nr:radical SAM protein [Patescibacteria group bacterium]